MKDQSPERTGDKRIESWYKSILRAYDLSSCGIGTQLHAIRLFSTRQPLPEWAQDALSVSGSNYLRHPSVWGWSEPTSDWAKFYPPVALSPHTDKHVALLKAMEAEYDDIKNISLNPTVFLDEQSRRIILRLATHKLGAMLGYTDQLLYEAKALGISVSTDLKPQGDISIIEKNWQRLFGEPMPSMSELYHQAHTVFIANMEPDDLLITHLIPLSSLVSV